MDERIEKIVSSPIFVPVVVGILAFSVGVVTGYNVGRRGKFHFRRQKQMAVMDPEVAALIAQSKAFRESIGKPAPLDIDRDRSEEFNSRAEFEREIEGLVTPDEDITVTIRPVPLDGDENTIVVQDILMIPPKEHVEDPPITHTIFAASVDHWDYEEEMANRTEDKPYVIHRDEFYGEEKGYTQMTLTYYEGDNIMVDEEDVPVYNFEESVGPMRFGHGTDDPNVFHVRNDYREAEFEIIRDRGHYSAEVLGLEIENQIDPNEEKHLKHSTDHVKRFRSDD
jgi:hypothetical protein